jgi:DNA-binding MarR family transcriptional regulator
MSFCFHALKSSTLFNQIILKELSKEGFTDLTPTLLGIFAHLAEAEPMSVSSLANRLNVTRQAMHKNTTLLEKLGYICLEIRAPNRKEKIVVLTQKGEELITISLEIIARTEEKMGKFLGRKEYQTFLAHQEKLTLLLEEIVEG